MTTCNNDNLRLAYAKGFRCDDQGDVFDASGSKRALRNIDGYLYLRFRDKSLPRKKEILVRVNRLQAFQKFGEAMFEPGLVVRHKDGNPLNNKPDNLLLGTHQDNMLDIPATIRMRSALIATSKVKKHNHEAIIKHHALNGWKATCEHFRLCASGLHYILRKSLAASSTPA